MNVLDYIFVFVLIISIILITYGYITYSSIPKIKQKKEILLLSPTIGEQQRIDERKEEPILDIFNEMFIGNQIIGPGGYDVNYGRIETQPFPNTLESL